MFRAVIWLMVLFASAVYADVPLYNGAVLLDENHENSGRQRLVTGKNHKSEGRWHFEKEVRVDGSLFWKTWQLDTVDSYSDIADFYQSWVDDSADKVLFECAGRECGSSNVWANDLFHEQRLYAPDADQRYWALQLDKDYYMLYLVQRGNERIYLHVRRIVPLDTDRSRLMLDENCRHPDLDRFMGGFDDGQSLLLLVSVPGDADQQQSIALAKKCRQRLQKDYPLTIRMLGLGRFDRQLEPVSSTTVELLLLPRATP